MRSFSRLGAADGGVRCALDGSRHGNRQRTRRLAGHLPFPFTYVQVQMVSRITTVNELKLNSADILCAQGALGRSSAGPGSRCALRTQMGPYLACGTLRWWSESQIWASAAGISWQSPASLARSCSARIPCDRHILHQFPAAIALAAACHYIQMALFTHSGCAAIPSFLESGPALFSAPCCLSASPLSL